MTWIKKPCISKSFQTRHSFQIIPNKTIMCVRGLNECADVHDGPTCWTCGQDTCQKCMRDLGETTLVYEWIKCPSCDTVLPIERYAHVPMPAEFTVWDKANIEAYLLRLHDTPEFGNQLHHSYDSETLPFFKWVATKKGRLDVQCVEQVVLQLITCLRYLSSGEFMSEAHDHTVFDGAGYEFFAKLLGVKQQINQINQINQEVFLENLENSARRLLYSFRTKEPEYSSEPALAYYDHRISITSPEGICPSTSYEAMALALTSNSFDYMTEFNELRDMYPDGFVQGAREKFMSWMYDWCMNSSVHDFSDVFDEGCLWRMLRADPDDTSAYLPLHVHNWTRESWHTFSRRMFSQRKCWGLYFVPITTLSPSFYATDASTLWNVPGARATLHAKILPLILAPRHCGMSDELWVMLAREYLIVGHVFEVYDISW